MPSLGRIKIVLLLLILILSRAEPVCFLSLIADKSDMPHENLTQKFLDRLFESMKEKFKTEEDLSNWKDKRPQEHEVNSLYKAVFNHLFPSTSTNTTSSEEFIKENTFDLRYIAKVVMYSANVALFGNSAINIFVGSYSLINFGLLAITTPILSFPYTEEISAAMSTIHNTDLDSWRYILLRKEKPISVPPLPPENSLTQFLKIVFPGKIMRNSDFKLKDGIKYLTDKTGYTLSSMLLILLLSTATAFTASVIENYLHDDEEEVFTDDDLLEEYKEDAEFHKVLEEWLTPKKQNDYDKQD